MKIYFFSHDCNTSFIINELLFLLKSNKVEQLNVITDYPINNKEISDHPKCKVCRVYGSRKSLSPGFLLSVFVEFLKHPFWYSKRNKWKETFFTSKNQLQKAKELIRLGIEENAILYTYWADSSAYLLACLKKMGLKNLTVTRMHAFDVYEYGDNHGYIPWRSFVYKKLDKLLPISVHGAEYVNHKYPFTLNKTQTIPLGIPLSDETVSLSPVPTKHIISCSWVGTRKNLTGVFDALHNMQDTTWTHLGDGEDFETLKTHTNRPAALKVQLPGRFSQEGIRSFYRDEQTTCFISLSTNEGLPVSMMEAMAFGIPVVSTDVGGCAEIVTPETGVLLPKSYTHEDVVNAVNICAEKFSSPEARKRIQEFIKANFDAQKNYQKFLDFLEEENTKHKALHS